jgi:peptide deformylase
MIYDILKYPAPELETCTESVQEITADIIEKIDSMVETMYQNKGIGLAANQVGLEESILVFDCSEEMDEPSCLINPKITQGKGSIVIEEGCLSFPGVNIHVGRFKTIVVEYMDINGNILKKSFKDLESICVQHEIDHLEGKTFFSRVNRQTRRRAVKEMKRLK